jgi:hypothetical protein
MTEIELYSRFSHSDGHPLYKANFISFPRFNFLSFSHIEVGSFEWPRATLLTAWSQQAFCQHRLRVLCFLDIDIDLQLNLHRAVALTSLSLVSNSLSTDVRNACHHCCPRRNHSRCSQRKSQLCLDHRERYKCLRSLRRRQINSRVHCQISGCIG